MSGNTTIATLLLALTCSPAQAKRTQVEDVYNREWCAAIGGAAEVRNSDGTRTDCLTLGYAVEADFVKGKWYEGVGQAVHYARLTGRLPGILLIIDSENDCDTLPEALASIAEARYVHPIYGAVPIKVWTTGLHQCLEDIDRG